MSDKYIIKNCDCILSSGKCNDKSLVYCQNCTDCVLKRIVYYCKSENEFYNNKVYKKDVELGRAIAASNVLQLLEIEECE